MITKEEFTNAYKNFAGVNELSEMITNDFIKHRNVEIAKKQHWWLRLRFPTDCTDLFFDNLLKLNYYEEALTELQRILNKVYINRNKLVKALITIRKELNRNVLNAEHIYHLSFENDLKPITKFGEDNKENLVRVLNSILNQDFPIGFLEEFCTLEENGRLKSKGKKEFLFGYYGLKGQLINRISIACSNLLREAENRLRIEMGGSKIGEGYISETELYYKIKEKFGYLKVIQHGRPQFLGRQHFDVWLPEVKIAIEYQGAQHDVPIDYFGGQEAFEKNQKRDELKKEKCSRNGVKLFEVRSGYDIDYLISRIESIILKSV